MALEQQGGRGRQGRAWISPPGNFYGSTLVELRPGDPQAQMLSLAAGLALIEAIDAAIPSQPLLLKWPNDVLLLGKKVAGILLERSGNRVVVGFGVNLAVAPRLDDRHSVALGGKVRSDGFAPVLAESFSRLLELWRNSDPAMLIQAWLARAHPLGTRLMVHSSDHERIRGRFDGLEADGALRLRLSNGRIETVRAGDVEL